GTVSAQDMLDLLQGRTSERKLRLFGCACCRLWAVPEIGDRALAVLDAAERYADGALTPECLAHEQETVQRAATAARQQGVRLTAWLSVHHVLMPEFGIGQAHSCYRAARSILAERDEQRSWYSRARTFTSAQFILANERLRDIIGNPYRPVAIDPA